MDGGDGGSDQFSGAAPVATTERLRIGMICPYSLTVPGGVQAQVLGLARTLRNRGHEVRVLGPCDGPPPAPFVTPLGNSLPTGINGSVAPLAPDVSAALRTIRALNDEAFDVLHLHEPLAPGACQTSLFIKLAPVVGTFHTAGDSAPYRVLRSPLAKLMERIDIRVAVSKDARELVVRYFGGDYRVLFNGIEVESFAPVGERQRERVVFFVGRHEERKGLGVLLKAMSSLPDDVGLWIASDGPQTPDLRAAYGSDGRITWLGRISDEEKIDRLRRCAAFCAPSLHGESFGVVLLEAMAAGAPVVASNLDGYRNVATNEVDALLTPPGDPDALGKALARVLGEPALVAGLVEAGHRRAEAHSMQRLAAEYERLYAEVLRMEAAAETVVKVPRILRRFESRFLRASRGGRGT